LGGDNDGMGVENNTKGSTLQFWLHSIEILRKIDCFMIQLDSFLVPS
jgi:hypothetical protein